MRASTIVWIIIILIVVLGGGWYYYSTQMTTPATSTTGTTQQPSTSNAAGINGSANQGNLGATDTGAVQQPEDNDAAATLKTDINFASDPTLGKYLTADNTSIHKNDMTLYTFDKDTAGKSNCTGQCAIIWPPLMVVSEDSLPNLGAGISGKLSTIDRGGGQYQVTYNGMPLYFYSADKVAGDVLGQNINKVWHVAKP